MDERKPERSIPMSVPVSRFVPPGEFLRRQFPQSRRRSAQSEVSVSAPHAKTNVRASEHETSDSGKPQIILPTYLVTALPLWEFNSFRGCAFHPIILPSVPSHRL